MKRPTSVMRIRGVAFGLAACLVMSGCAAPSMLVAASQVELGASLRMALDLGREVQVIGRDLSEIQVDLTFEDGRTESRTVARPASVPWIADLSNLPSGEASIKVTAKLATGEVVGHAYTMATLVPGRRSYTTIHILLATHGKTTLEPYSPLNPLTDLNLLGSQFYGRVIVPSSTGQLFSAVAVQPYTSSYEGGATYTGFTSYGKVEVSPTGAANFFNLHDGTYYLGYHPNFWGGYGGGSDIDAQRSIATQMPQHVEFALSKPVMVTSHQTVVPEALLDLTWDLRGASPTLNAILGSREVTFEFPAKPGLVDPKYAIEIYDAIDASSNAPRPLLQRYETSAHDPVSGKTRVSFTLADVVRPGTRYYMLKYWEGSGSYGGENAYGRTPLIPFTVPTPPTPAP